MTAQRRGRNGYGSRKRQRQVIPQPQPSQSTSEEESTDGGSVTRCVCGESHNMGLMVQCDQCEVWQHCECVGLEEQDIPDQYYCEECKPENHSVIRLSHGRIRRSYSSIGKHATSATVEKKAPKKRMTFNSREASMSLEDVLAARNAMEFTRSLLDPIPDSPPPQQQQQHSDEHDIVEEKAMSQSPMTDTKDHDTTLESNAPVDDAIEMDKVISKSKRLNSGRSSKNEENSRQSSESSSVASGRVTKANEKRPRANNGRRTNSSSSRRGQNGGASVGNKPRSRTSTPQPVDNASSSSTSDARSSIFDKLSPAARESSPPARVRYPSARMTISEMNRRTKQILEYISSIQVEMANKETMSPSCHCPQITTASSSASLSSSSNNPIGAGTDQNNNNNSNNKPASIIIPEKKVHDSPSSSMSSASTIPLEESAMEEEARIHHEEKSVAEEAIEKMNASKEQSSLEIMDMLTRELIKFQRRFGSTAVSTQLGRGRQRDDDEREGRMTRSREASTSSNFFSEKRTAHA
ncbi:hypothetical protein LRAMOSA08936 [Lichtheimia ramosa]|uniref:PHD-type domain-containing protein n=1 Tax=Lichtheimia ramosa TaxID=688394 RepID=A0A077WH99_9FUNG|nr:hypothetical protein LRAMOSA08936 [Lichtheimia ramosa]